MFLWRPRLRDAGDDSRRPLEASVLRELERLQKREGKSLGQLISELVAAALAHEEEAPEEGRPFQWTARPMEAHVDLEDKEAVRAALDADAS